MVKRSNKTNSKKCESDCKCNCQNEEGNSFVAIAASLGGLLVGAIAIFGIFARENMALLIPIAWSIATLGIFAEFFNYLSIKSRNK